MITFPMLSGVHSFTAQYHWTRNFDIEEPFVVWRYQLLKSCTGTVPDRHEDIRILKKYLHQADSNVVVFTDIPFMKSFNKHFFKGHESDSSILYIRGAVKKCTVEWDERICEVDLKLTSVHTNIPDKFIESFMFEFPYLSDL